MIQLLGLRKFTDPVSNKEIKTDAFFERNWRAPTVADVFQNPETYLKAIDPEERYNIFFTQASCGAGKREFKEQWVIGFDFDGCDPERAQGYVKLFAEELGIPIAAVGALWSGHGIHLAVNISSPLAVGDFKKYRLHYQRICQRLENVVRGAGLPLKCVDPQFFAPGMSFRLPGTWNRKEGQEPVRVLSIQAGMREVITWDWAKLSGLPVLNDGDALEGKNWKPDPQGVLEGCDFLKWCKQDPGRVNEAQWYALLSVIGRLPGGEKLAHEYSQGHPGYSEHETDQKLKQAMSHSGPRTCQGINSLWGECHKCPHFEKVNSPISVRGPDYIATQDTGFHTWKPNKDGVLLPHKPQYGDLRKYFERQTFYKVMGESRICYTWKGTHYEEMPDPYLENFAQKEFNPQADNKMVSEFVKLVCRTNLTPPDWFNSSTDKKINFKNGVYDLRTNQFTEGHSPEIGFRYVLPYAYDPAARAPRFEKFLEEVMSGDPQLIAVLIEFMGYCCSMDTCWAGKALMLSGSGENGKSIFIEVLQELVGPENYSSETVSGLKNETNRQLLEGKFFNLAEETPRKGMEEPAYFKIIVTGGQITVRKYYKMPYKIRNKAKLIFSVNETPTSEDVTRGFFRRFQIIPFRQRFTDENGRKDPFILEKLKTELPGIFNLAVEGYRRLKAQQKFTHSDASARELEAYQNKLDNVRRWTSEAVTLQEDAPFIPYIALYGQYAIWCTHNGERAVNSSTFVTRFRTIYSDKNCQFKKGYIDGKQVRGVVGIAYQDETVGPGVKMLGAMLEVDSMH